MRVEIVKPRKGEERRDPGINIGAGGVGRGAGLHCHITKAERRKRRL